MFHATYTKESQRFPSPGIQEDDALTAYNRVLADAGASHARDSVDARVVDEVIRRTGHIIDSQADVGGWPDIPPAQAPADSDRDGMPDAWERASGLNPDDPEDRNGDLNHDGYTNLEEYLNGRRPDTNLVGRWRLDEGSGKVAADSSQYGASHPGRLVGGAAFVPEGRIGGAGALDGANDYVSLSSPDDTDCGATGERTVSVWFKATNASLARKQVIYAEGSTSRGLNVYLQKGRLYAGGWNSATAWLGTFLQTGGVSSMQWHQVVLVLDGGSPGEPGSLRAYLDGVEFGAGTGAAMWSDGGSIGLGGLVSKARFHNGILSPRSCYFAGMIDDARIYNRALAASEVQALFCEVPAVERALTPAADATVTGLNPQDQTDLTGGGDAALGVRYTSGSTGPRGSARLQKTYIRFQLPGDVQQVTDARLELFSTRDGADSGTFQVYALREAADYGTNTRTNEQRLDEMWDEFQITYNNAPANVDSGTSNSLNATYAGLLGKFHPQRNKGTVVALDSTTALIDFLNADTNGSVTFIIVSSASTSKFGTFASRECGGDFAPRLVCQYLAE
jgi:hypothetical protein